MFTHICQGTEHSDMCLFFFSCIDSDTSIGLVFIDIGVEPTFLAGGLPISFMVKNI